MAEYNKHLAIELANDLINNLQLLVESLNKGTEKSDQIDRTCEILGRMHSLLTQGK